MTISKGRALSATVNSATSLIKSSIDGTVTTTTLEQSAQQYANAAALPSVGNTFGEMALVQSTNRMYVWNGSGWYNVALINTNPTFTTSPSASYEFDADSPRSNITITVAASDPESLGVSFSFETGGSMDSMASVTQDSSVFTLVPKGNDSLTDGVTLTGSLTIKATDGVNIVPEVSSFTLAFITIIENSSGTNLLLKASGTGDNNAFDDKSTTNHVVTASGTVTQGTFSPFRHGGYSIEFDAYGDEIEFPDIAAYDIGTSQFSVEAWVYPTAGVNNYSCGIIAQFASASRGWGMTFNNTQIKFYGSSNGGSSTNTVHTATYTVPHFQWSHIVTTRDDTNIRIFVNGQLILAAANTAHYHNSTQPLRIGEANSGTAENFQGYMRDVRLVVGSIPTEYQTTSTTVNTGIFTPPTEPLTAITNTVLLTCHTNHLVDGSTNKVYPSVNATPTVIGFSPYDSKSYLPATHGGSFRCPGTSDEIKTNDGASNAIGLGSGDFTVEFWIHKNNAANSTWEALVSQKYGSTGGWRVYKSTGSGQVRWYAGSTDTLLSDSSNPIRQNVWSHVAMVRSSGTLTWYINGKNSGSTGSHTYNYTGGAAEIEIGKGTVSSTYPTQANITDVRIVNGTAVYTGDFTPPSAPLTTTGGTYPSNTNVNTSIPSGHCKLLLNMTQSKVRDASQTSNQLALVGGTVASSDQHFSENTVEFPGSSDYIKIDQQPFADGEIFTIEGWHNLDARTNYSPCLFNNYTSHTTGSLGLFAGHGSSTTTQYQLSQNGVFPAFNAGTVAYNQWVHFAVQRNLHNNIQVYIDGTQVGSDLGSAIPLSGIGNDFYIGSAGDTIAAGSIDGHLHDFRISKGLTRFPFIPEKQTLTTTNSQRSGVSVTASNVTLLTCHAATITDGSSNGTSITTNGNAAVSNFGPASGMKSVYFDGTGDYLQCTLADTLGTADWTVEYWVYHNSISGNQIHCAFNGYAPAFYRRNSSNAFAVYHNPGISGNHNANITPVAHKWYHMAYCHDDSDNVLRVFANGALVDEFAYSGNISGTTFRIGDDGTSAWMNGYISNLRIVKSTVVYSKTFTPTTSALNG